MDELTSLRKYNDYRDNNFKTAKTYHQLEMLGQSLDNINYREELLNQEMSIFPLLPKLTNTLEPYYKMWNTINKFKFDQG